MFAVLNQKQIENAYKVATKTPDFCEEAYTDEWGNAPLGAFTVLRDCAIVKVRTESSTVFNPQWDDYQVTFDYVQVALCDLHLIFCP